MKEKVIEDDWYKRFFSIGNDVGSGKIVDHSETTIHFEEVQHQMNFMFLLLQALTKSNQSTQAVAQKKIIVDQNSTLTRTLQNDLNSYNA